MMPELVPQTLIMDQQLELPSNWYGGFDGKRGSSPGSFASPDELLSSLCMQNDWSLHGDHSGGESRKGSELDRRPARMLSLGDPDEDLASFIPPVSATSQVMTDDLDTLGSHIEQGDSCCDGWAELESTSRTVDEDRLGDRSFEDVFQVDTQDILCSPTLAQLNAEQDCSELLEDISNIIVKDEYGSAEAAVLASTAQGSLGSSQTLSGPNVEQTPQAFNQTYSPDMSAGLVRGAADYMGMASTSTWNLADFQPTIGPEPGAGYAQVTRVQHPEKRRRLSDTVTLYDLLISKSSPQQLQVMINRGDAVAPDQDQERSVGLQPKCVLQHKRPRHAAALSTAGDGRVARRSSQASQASSCDGSTMPPAAVPTPHDPRGHRSTRSASALLRARQLSECSTASNYDAPEDEDDEDGGYGGGYTSDAGSCSSCSTWTSSKDGKQCRPQRRRRGHSPYFWQYNSQSKGPRGERFELTLAPSDDPHKPVNFTDPVFDPEQHVRIRHVGRARKGDGNDVRPNPRRLVSIGKELAKLNRLMSDVAVPLAAAGGASSAAAATAGCTGGDGGKPDCKREKNKLASRACRLKKKAQHEANKVKLCGLEQERKELMEVLDAIKSELQKHQAAGLSAPQSQLASAPTSSSQQCVMQSISFTGLVKELMSRHLVTKVAGRTSQFVSEVVAQVEAGDPLGGLTAED